MASNSPAPASRIRILLSMTFHSPHLKAVGRFGLYLLADRCKLRANSFFYFSTTVALMMVTGSTGTFWCMPLLAVGTALILSTTSWPLTTLPKTA